MVERTVVVMLSLEQWTYHLYSYNVFVEEREALSSVFGDEIPEVDISFFL